MIYKESISKEELENLEQLDFKGEIVLIDSENSEYYSALNLLARSKVIGFDTETRPTFRQGERKRMVALLQLSNGTRVFLFRINKMGLPKGLCDLLSNNDIIKVGAAVHDDIIGLQRYVQFQPAGFVDLQSIGRFYGILDKSVRKMSAIILGVRISKTQQLSNWEAGSLSESQMRYAAIDAWICRQMYLKLKESPVVIGEGINKDYR